MQGFAASFDSCLLQTLPPIPQISVFTPWASLINEPRKHAELILCIQPDDALWNEVEEKASAFIDEKHLTETGGKTFLTLTAIGWEKDRLRFRLEAGFSEIEDRYLFDGLLDPAELKVRDWKVSKATASTRQ